MKGRGKRAGALAGVILAGIISSGAIAADGVEIGNGKTISDRGGFEIGNGFIVNRAGLYKLKKIFGDWKVDYFNKFTEFTAVSEDQVKTRASIDVLKMDNVLSGEELIEISKAEGWIPVQNIKNVQGVKKDTVSLSGIRELEYRLFQAPMEVVKVLLVGPQGDPGFSAFEQFQKSLESIEMLPR